MLLVETDGDVSSYRGANFGCIPLWTPPPQPGHRLFTTGKFSAPEHFYASNPEFFSCPEDSLPDPLITADVDTRCYGGQLRGSVTEIAAARNAFRVMATWVIAGNFPVDLKVGDRVAVHVVPGPGPAGWMLDSLILPWDERHDELLGPVEAVEVAPDGQILRIRVLNTWVFLPTPAIEGR